MENSVNNKKDEKEEKKVLHHIFALRKISHIEIEIFNGLFKVLSRPLYNIFTTTFRKEINLKLDELKKMKYVDFVDSLKTPLFCIVLDFKDINSQGLFIILTPLNKLVADKLMGGPGERFEDLNLEELTEIEINVLNDFSKNIINNFSFIFKPLIGEKVEIQRLETIPTLIRILSENDEILVARFKIILENEDKGEILFCFPYLSIQSNIEVLYKELYKGYYSEKDKENLIKILLETPINLNFTFRSTKISLSRLDKLKEGETLVLPIDIDEFLICEIQKIPYFLCKVGRIKNKIAFKIIGRIENE
ncbi:MAG: FliM/FliN family flagellar motor switch protein [bacterium]|nr:FliM/FliN family flagellar motor switch protein [bacterium]MDW8163683.1 FliM/FliN family flagellar motor switch protein [Candidatus Omnitrophota bacterium]